MFFSFSCPHPTARDSAAPERLQGRAVQGMGKHILWFFKDAYAESTAFRKFTPCEKIRLFPKGRWHYDFVFSIRIPFRN